MSLSCLSHPLSQPHCCPLKSLARRSHILLTSQPIPSPPLLRRCLRTVSPPRLGSGSLRASFSLLVAAAAMAPRPRLSARLSLLLLLAALVLTVSLRARGCARAAEAEEGQAPTEAEVEQGWQQYVPQQYQHYIPKQQQQQLRRDGNGGEEAEQRRGAETEEETEGVARLRQSSRVTRERERRVVQREERSVEKGHGRAGSTERRSSTEREREKNSEKVDRSGHIAAHSHSRSVEAGSDSGHRRDEEKEKGGKGRRHGGGGGGGDEGRAADGSLRGGRSERAGRGDEADDARPSHRLAATELLRSDGAKAEAEATSAAVLRDGGPLAWQWSLLLLAVLSIASVVLLLLVRPCVRRQWRERWNGYVSIQDSDGDGGKLLR